jgi:hypothetical protein
MSLIYVRYNQGEGETRIATGAAIVAALCLATSAEAQQPVSAETLERVRLALQSSPPQPGLTSPTPLVGTAPEIKRFGILTLLPPDTSGEIVSVRVPVGDLATRAARAVAAVQHRRAERRAHEDVVRALQDFQAQPPAR